MPRAVLVAYATRAGSTEGAAQAVGEAFVSRGIEVEVRPVSEVDSLSGYGAVVLGTAIRAGRPLREAVKFVRSNRERLAGMSVAYFAVCMNMTEDSEKNRQETKGWLAPLRELVEPKGLRPDEPVDIGLFAGVMDTKKLGCLLGTIFGIVSRATGVKQGDYRDWEKIRAWAEGLAPKLVGGGLSEREKPGV